MIPWTTLLPQALPLPHEKPCVCAGGVCHCVYACVCGGWGMGIQLLFGDVLRENKKRTLWRGGGGRKRSRGGSIVEVILVLVSAWKGQGMCLWSVSCLDTPCLLQQLDKKKQGEITMMRLLFHPKGLDSLGYGWFAQEAFQSNRCDHGIQTQLSTLV